MIPLQNSKTPTCSNASRGFFWNYICRKEAKPKPEPVLKTLATMHYDACETLVVGDMAVDIQMGTNGGTKTCGVTWGVPLLIEIDNLVYHITKHIKSAAKIRKIYKYLLPLQ